jgi:hypothetical protein
LKSPWGLNFAIIQLIYRSIKKGGGDKMDKSTEPDDTKSVTVFAAIIMTFSCPHCNEPVEIKSEAVPNADFQTVCSKCNGSFFLKLNQRQSYRKEVSIPLSYSLFDIDDFSDRRAKKGTMTDISKSGLSIKADMSKFSELYEKTGNVLFLLFSLPGKEQILKVKGEIITVTLGRDKTFQMGMKFLNLTDHHNKAIGFFLMP